MLEVGVVVIGGVIVHSAHVRNHAFIRILALQYGIST